ncbi:MAG: (d)CMP kinase [Candidatus Omnitrophota bacterium]|nr:MAG: (d)CMP kinase [Candidatus Omnitrophota bacterium]
MERFKKISIIGTGLIGGSLGLAIKQKGLSEEVLGIDISPLSIEEAVRMKAVDRGSLRIEETKGSELILICTPISDILPALKTLIPFLEPGSIITDVGSVKKEVLKQAEKILPSSVYFIGGHPLAGSEKRGVSFAHADLFKDSLTLLVESKKANAQALERVKNFWEGIGSKVRIVSLDEHEEIVGMISHLPHIVAISLVNSVPRKCFSYVARGWKDSTRIALSPPELWRDICVSNRKQIVKGLNRFIEVCEKVKKIIEKGEKKKIEREFKRAREKKIRYEPMVIAIDGPAGAGKSVVGKEVAKRLGFVYLDTGAMYRAITLKAIEEGIDLEDEKALIEMCRNTDINFESAEDGRIEVLLDGKSLGERIRDKEITRKVFYLARIPEVRERMVELQRKIAEGKSIVAEGRDMTSVVFPQARKFYLDASLQERARRRYRQLLAQNQKVSFEEIKMDIQIRDRKDKKRKVGPLRKVKDALYIDSTRMSIEEVVEKILKSL